MSKKDLGFDLFEAGNTEKISGSIDGVIYHNNENGYTVFVLKKDDTSETITCTGYLHEPLDGENLVISGNFVHNHRYGRQFSITSFERTKPTTLAGIEKYLASGVIKGIGDKTAREIVKRFGEEAFDIIENEPKKLTKIRGVSLKKALLFSEIFHSTKIQRQSMLFLQELGLSSAAAMKVYKKYGEETSEIVRQNPYRLADDIDGIGFKTADAIAFRLGMQPDNPERISAGVRYSLWEATSEGHTYVPQDSIVKTSSDLLYVDASIIQNELMNMQINRQIMREKPEGSEETLVFATPLYYAEIYIARKLSALNHAHSLQAAAIKSKPGTKPQDDDFIRRFGKENLSKLKKLEEENAIELSVGQRLAVLLALSQGVLIITGGPGTGKTTTINTIIGLLESQGLDVSLAAPTGRAAKRMTEATGREAKTIHRLLEVNFISEDNRRQVFNKNEDNPVETDVLIVDETSMMDVLLTQSLLKAVAEGTRLIFVGDVDQLPSVGPGNMLKDIINSDTLPVARLTEVFRQAAESAIITNAHRINKGQYPSVNEKEKDFFFMKRRVPEDISATIVDLVINRLTAYKNFDPKTDIQVLTPMRKGQLGVQNLNKVLQEKINPPSPQKKEREYGQVVFREGDKVMQIRNNYDAKWETYNKNGVMIDFGSGIFNGDMGVVEAIDEETGLIVCFDESRYVEYEFSQLDELELAYAVTIHKSQGSEYRVIVMPVFSGPPMLFTRNLLYTAVTRAKELAVLVGGENFLHRMVDNNRISKRFTTLKRRLKDMAEVLCIQ